MKYRVIITQRLKYDERLVACFDDMAKAFVFAQSVFESCDSVSVNIELIEEEGEE